MLSVKCRGFKLILTFADGEKVPKILSVGMIVFLVGMEIRCFLLAGQNFGIIFSPAGDSHRATEYLLFDKFLNIPSSNSDSSNLRLIDYLLRSPVCTV